MKDKKEQIRFAKTWMYYFVIYMAIGIGILLLIAGTLTGMFFLIKLYGVVAIMIACIVLCWLVMIGTIAAKKTSDVIKFEDRRSNSVINALKKEY